MKRRSLKKSERNKRKKETQSDEENSGDEHAGPSRVNVVKHGTDETGEQPGPSRVGTVEKRTQQTDEGETGSRYVPIYDPIRAQMYTSNIGRNTPAYTQQMYPHSSMLQGASDAIAYNQQMMMQPTTSHHPWTQFREEQFNPAGVFAVENRAYQTGRAHAENSAAIAYKQHSMMQLSTPHHSRTQFRPGSSNQLQYSTYDLRHSEMHDRRYVNDASVLHQQTFAQSTSLLGQTASNQHSGTRRIELSFTGGGKVENLFVGNDHLYMDNRQTSSQVPHVSQTNPSFHTEPTARNQSRVGIQRIRKILKDYIERECRGGVTEHYNDLTEPTKEVFPKLLGLLRLYEGDLMKEKMFQFQNNTLFKYEPEASLSFTDLLQMVSQSQKDPSFKYGDNVIPPFTDLLEMMSQYQKDPAFRYGTPSGEELDYETFLHRIIETETKRVSVIAQAGSGKTVMLKRLARDLMKHNDELLVFFMNFRDFTDSKEITPCDFLINGRLPDSDAKLSYEWILENQDKVMLVLDGLDQATWDIDEKAKLVGDYSTGKVSEIVSSIFKEKLFPDVKVVYSSREHAVALLKGQLRPKMVFALTGLSPGDSEWLFKSFVGENQEILWEKLRTQSHSLIPLLSIPAFLIFTTIVYVKKPENQPRSMTEVLSNLLEIFMQSGHITEEDVPTVLAGLKKMSFVGMKDGKVIFYINNVQDAGLDPKQICDWIIRIPGLNKCNQFLLEGQYVFMFSHQTIQEFLAAQYIIEMDFKSFEDVVMEYLGDGKWSVVTRFVTGLLFNDEISVDLNADDVEQKRNALKIMMMEKIVGLSLEWLAAVSESNHNVFIGDLVHDILPSGFLGDSGAYVIASVMRHLVHLNQLMLRSCHLTSENLQILSDNIENSSLKISKLDISGNTDMEDKGYATLGKIVKMCAVDELSLGGCMLSDGKLKNLLSETDGAKISKLYVSLNPLNEATAAMLGDIVKRCSVEELTMRDCGLNDGSLKSLLSGSSGAKLLSIDVRNIGSIITQPNNLSAALLDEISRSITVKRD